MKVINQIMKDIKIIAVFFAFVWLFSCSGYVNGIDAPINNISDEELNNPIDVKVLTTGLYNDWSSTWDNHTLLIEGLSDAMEFHKELKGATYPSYEAIDLANVVGEYPLDDRNSSLAALFREVGRLRLLADTLVYRVNNKVVFSTEEELEIRNDALYYGYFFGGIARYMYAYYWALTPNKPGGVINKSALIPSKDLYNSAIQYLHKAKQYANAHQQGVINTLIARIHLILGNYQEALEAAEFGLFKGDEDFKAYFNTVNINIWNSDATSLRIQFCAADRYGDYIYKNPNEASRIPIIHVNSEIKVQFDTDTVIAGIKYNKGEVYKRKFVIQNKYELASSPIVFASWQENSLMLAELYYRLTQDIGIALDIINFVRAEYKLPALHKELISEEYADFYDLLAEERDKTLCFTGLRIMDQRRLNKWHRAPNNSWMYFPITIQEKNNNPNLK